MFGVEFNELYFLTAQLFAFMHFVQICFQLVNFGIKMDQNFDRLGAKIDKLGTDVLGTLDCMPNDRFVASEKAQQIDSESHKRKLNALTPQEVYELECRLSKKYVQRHRAHAAQEMDKKPSEPESTF